MSSMTLNVNGRTHTVDVDPATPLLYVLSDDLEPQGPKFGCGLSQCGACTVIVRGQAVRSCVTPVGSVGGTEITTFDGLGTIQNPHPLQQAFIEEQAAQCGFCLNGVIMTAKAFLDRTPKATRIKSSRRCRTSCADVSRTDGCCAPSSATRTGGLNERDPERPDARRPRRPGTSDRTHGGRIFAAIFLEVPARSSLPSLPSAPSARRTSLVRSGPPRRRASTGRAARSSTRGSRSRRTAT